MKKKHFVKILSILLPVLVICLIILISLIKQDQNKEPDQVQIIDQNSENEGSQESNDPIPLDQLIEEFNQELAGDGEEVNPEDFSEYQEEYVVEVQEDEVVDIH